MNKENLRAYIDAVLDHELHEVYTAEHVTTGDISPEQTERWDAAVEAVTDIFAELVAANKGSVEEQ